MEFVWQSSKTSATKRTSQACQNCRARKKRCYHVEKVVAEGPEGPALEPPSDLTTRESSPDPGRVSDYNPESVLADLSKAPELAPGIGQLEPSPAHSQLGRDLAQPVEQCSSPAQQAQRRLSWYKRHKRKIAPPPLSEPYRLYLESVGAFLELPRETTDVLLPLYITLLDDLIPILDGASVFRDYSNGQSSTYLIRAVCLIACKVKQAAPYLRLSDDGPLLGPLDFASKLLTGLDAAIKADLEPDRVTKVQILALMHLHNDGLSGADRSSSYLSQAISEAWAMCLHWNVPGNPDKDQCDFLWWSLRTFDRLNKPVMGAAPFIIDDTDVAIQRIVPRRDSYRSQIMGVTITLGDLMAMATKIYKASSTATVDDCQNFPSLSELTSGIDFHRFHRSHRAYLEIWYHVASMLSCRYSGPGSVPYNRRLASADRILDIISRQGQDNLPPLPLIPYGLSMSTTMIYRALRDDQRDIGAVCGDLRRCCDALDTLSQRWTSAKGVAKLAKRLWEFLTRTRTSNGPPDGRSEHLRRSTRSQVAAAATATNNRSSAKINPRNNEQATLEEVVIPTPVSIQTEQPSHGGQVSDSNQNFQGQHIEAWPGIDASYFQLDRAFQDLFDYGMPNVFRNPATWEFSGSVEDE